MPCQSGVWNKQGGNGEYGEYKFQLADGFNLWYRGVGRYFPALGQFEGHVTCDWVTGPADCGSHVYGIERELNGSATNVRMWVQSNGRTVRTLKLPVVNVVRIW